MKDLMLDVFAWLENHGFGVCEEYKTLVYSGLKFDLIDSKYPSIFFCYFFIPSEGIYLPEINSIILSKDVNSDFKLYYSLIEECVHASECHDKGLIKEIQSYPNIDSLWGSYKGVRFKGNNKSYPLINIKHDNGFDDFKKQLLNPLENEHGLVKGLSLLIFDELVFDYNYVLNDFLRSRYALDSIMNLGAYEIIERLKC